MTKQWHRASVYDATWTCQRCGQGRILSRAYPSPRAVCPYCGAREAGPPVIEPGPEAEMLVCEWPDRRGARVYSDDGQHLSLTWAAWDRVMGQIADVRGGDGEDREEQ